MITANMMSAHDTIVLTKSHSVAHIFSQLSESNLGPSIKFSTIEQVRNGRGLAVTFPFDQVPSRHPHLADHAMHREDNIKLHLPNDHNQTGVIAGDLSSNREARQRIRNIIPNTGRGDGLENADFEGSGNGSTDTESVPFEEILDAEGRCISKIEMKEVEHVGVKHVQAADYSIYAHHAHYSHYIQYCICA